MIKFIQIDIAGEEEYIGMIRDVWTRYASPQYVDLLDTEHAAIAEAEQLDPEKMLIEPPAQENPARKLADILQGQDGG